MEVSYHFIKKHLANGDVSLVSNNTTYQLGGIFRKPLNKDKIHLYPLNYVDLITLISKLQFILIMFLNHAKLITLLI